MNRSIFLASGSPRRQAILTQFHISYTLIPNLLDTEVIDSNLDIRAALRKLAYEKAVTSQSKYKGLILTADTTVVLNDTTIGKPSSVEDAKKTLQMLSGQTHQVITAFCVLDTFTNIAHKRSDCANVTFRSLTDTEIDAYIKKTPPLDKAGAYNIEEVRNSFIAGIKGSYYTIMGLPIASLLRVLRKYDIVS